MMFHGIIYDEIAMRNFVCVECLKQIEHLQFICTNFCIRKKIGKCTHCFLFQQHTANWVHSQFLTKQEFKKPYAPFLIESVLGDCKNTKNFKSQTTFFHFSACCQKMRMLPLRVFRLRAWISSLLFFMQCMCLKCNDFG